MALSASVIGVTKPTAFSPEWHSHLRYYIAGMVHPGMFPHQLQGQAELLKTASITAQQTGMR